MKKPVTNLAVEDELLKGPREEAQKKGLPVETVLEAAIRGVDPASLPNKPGTSSVRLVGGPPRTAPWAKLAGPFGWAVVGLTIFVFVAPFIGIMQVSGLGPDARIDQLRNWATHVLAATVGFTSTVLGYFFGKESASK